MYWCLKSGNDCGIWTGVDYNKTLVRDYGYEFCSNVRDLDSKQWTATGISGTYAGAIAATIAAAGPTAGVSVIVGIIAAILSGSEVISAWVDAYNASLNCNQTFTKFKQAL